MEFVDKGFNAGQYDYDLYDPTNTGLLVVFVRFYFAGHNHRCIVYGKKDFDRESTDMQVLYTGAADNSYSDYAPALAAVVDYLDEYRRRTNAT